MMKHFGMIVVLLSLILVVGCPGAKKVEGDKAPAGTENPVDEAAAEGTVPVIEADVEDGDGLLPAGLPADLDKKAGAKSDIVDFDELGDL